MLKLRTWLAEARLRWQPLVDRGERHWAVTLLRNYFDDDPDGLASMLAFAAMFSLMPILVVTFAVVTLLLRISLIENEILELIAEETPDVVADIVEQMVEAGSGNLTALGLMTAITFLLGGTRLYNAMDRACAHVFRTPRRSTVGRRMFTLIAMPLIPLLLLGATVVAVAATAILTLPLERLIDTDPSNQQTALIYLSAFFLAFSMLFLAYWRIPVHGPGVRYAAEAAAITSILVILLAQIFPVFIAVTGGYNIYGSLFAFALLILFWLYWIGHIFVIGAEIAAYRSGRRRGEPLERQVDTPNVAEASADEAGEPT